MELETNIIILDAPLLRYLEYNLNKTFSREKKHLEIGFGNGQYLIEYAIQKKDEVFLGIEYAKKYFLKAFQRAQRHRVSNVRLIYGEANSILELLFPDELFDVIHINFPDPWPKKRHKERRLINENFVKNLLRVLKKDGIIFFVSDYEEYFINSVSIFRDNGLKVEYLSDIQNRERIAKTKYENDFIRSGKKIFYSVLKKS